MNPTVTNGPSGAEVSRADVERMSQAWDRALAEKDVSGLLNLYAADAVLESPLIPYLLGQKEGVCRGPEEMRPFYERVAEEVARASNEARPLHGPHPVICGNKVVWENPRIAPDGRPSETSSFIEVWEVSDGSIKHHHAYWGWDRMAKRSNA